MRTSGEYRPVMPMIDSSRESAYCQHKGADEDRDPPSQYCKALNIAI